MKSEIVPFRENVSIPDYLDEYSSDIGIGHIVELREHNPRYLEIFLKESTRITAAFGQLPISLHHVGSTSVEGLCAKPIIDMLLTYPEPVTLENIRKTLTGLGYFFREDLLPNRNYFILEDDKRVRYFAITVSKSDDESAKEMLTFRDNLRNDPSIMEEYATIKRRLSAETTDREEYTNQKSEFIRKHSKQ